MAQTWNSRRLRQERDMDRRFVTEHRAVARAAAAIVARAGQGPEPAPVPNTRQARAALKAAIWGGVLKPYYIGQGDDPLAEAEPRSPYARLLRDGVEGALRIQAERQAALIAQVVHDEAVVQWLTGPRPITAVTEVRGSYDPWHTWVDPNGYRLSDRIWRAGINERAHIDQMLDYHIQQGTPAVQMADLLEEYLTPGAGAARTRRPYGREGSYAARRLARTEISAASGRGTINAAMANPFVEGVQWRLSRSHPCCDVCDEYARGGPNGDGIYAPGAVGQYPAHPNCMCALVPVPAGNTGDLVERLREDIRANAPRARQVQGLFNPGFLASALLTGVLADVLERMMR